MIFVFGLLIAMTWLLPTETFGTIVLIKSLLIIICSISNFGLSQSLVKFIDDKESSTHILGTSFIIILISGIISSTLLLIFIQFLNFGEFKPDNYFLVSIFFSSLFFLFCNEILNYFRSRNETHYYLSFYTLRYFLQFALITGSVFYYETINSYFLGFVISEFILILISSRFIYISISFDYVLAKKLIYYGTPHAIIITGSFIITYLDRFLLSYFHGDNSIVGVYEVAYLLVTSSLGLIIRPYNLKIFPMYVKSFENDGEYKTELMIRDIQGKYMILAFFGCLLLLIFAPIITNLFFPNTYQVNIFVYFFLGYSIILTGQIMANSAGINIKEKTILLVYPIIVAILINLVLNIFLIPRYLLVGAAGATLIAVMAQLVMVYFLSKKYLNTGFPYLIVCICTIFLLIISYFLIY